MSAPSSTSAIKPESPCPCGSGQTFGACCQPILQQTKKAATAEQLMRSRFTAHVVCDYEHLHRTYLETSRKPYVPEPNAEGMTWTRLVINAHEAGPKPDIAFVDFTAYYQGDGGEFPLHEKSEFQRINGDWFYTKTVRQGPAPIKSQAKVGRNDPCPCGSGKKYKQCCLVKA